MQHAHENSEGLLTRISADLVHLTRHLVTAGLTGDQTGGYGLGGEYGYGVHFENDVFEMHPFYWGDCVCGREDAEWEWTESHRHAPDCYQSVILARGFIDVGEDTGLSRDEVWEHNRRIVEAVCAQMGLDPLDGAYVHCTCTYRQDWREFVASNPHEPTCGIEQPNFRHKPSGATVCWYKYIGRGMQVDLRETDWSRIYADALASVSHD